MRAKRALWVRLASGGGALALATAGLAGSIGLTASNSVAGADTPPFTATCSLITGPTQLSNVVVKGSISPSTVQPGGTFTLAGLQMSLSLPSSLTTLILGKTISGTFTTDLTATGATPVSQLATFAIPVTTITAANPPLVSPGTVGSFTADSSGSNSITVSTGTTGTITAVISGTAVAPGSCTEPSEVIASTSVATPPGTVTSVRPNAGPPAGGTLVTIGGSFLGNPTAVNFGKTPAVSFSGKTANSLTAVAPPGISGTLDVHVVTAAGISAANPGDHFTYTAGPIVTGVSPSTSTPAGGISVTITGQQLGGVFAVNFGSTPAASFTVNSATSITAVAPAGNGLVNVTVTGVYGPSLAGTSVISPQDLFNYRTGYWLTASDGGVFNYGSSPFEGSAGGTPLNKPIVGMASTPDAGGYWLVASDGGIFTYGDAGFYGSAGATPLNKPMVGMASTPDGGGYWLVASDGGIFTYGDAQFFGSAGGTPLNKPIVGMASTPDGGGYWLVASDGGIFTYGDAGFYGSAGATPLNKPMVGMASTSDGGGYWLVASDGGIFTYGDATFHGSAGATPLNKPMVGMASTSDGGGYWLVASDGGIFTYGDATFYGSAGGTPLNKPMVGMAAVS